MDFDDIDDSNVDYSQSTNRNNQRDTFYNQPPMIQVYLILKTITKSMKLNIIQYL